jgi:hypothetical protein
VIKVFEKIQLERQQKKSSRYKGRGNQPNDDAGGEPGVGARIGDFDILFDDDDGEQGVGARIGGDIDILLAGRLSEEGLRNQLERRLFTIWLVIRNGV